MKPDFYHKFAMGLGFLMTPFILGTALMITLASDILIIKEPEVLNQKVPPPTTI